MLGKKKKKCIQCPLPVLKTLSLKTIFHLTELHISQTSWPQTMFLVQQCMHLGNAHGSLRDKAVVKVILRLVLAWKTAKRAHLNLAMGRQRREEPLREVENTGETMTEGLLRGFLANFQWRMAPCTKKSEAFSEWAATYIDLGVS